jgi:hypothetical protein
VLAPGSTLFVSVITLPATRVLAAGKPRATWLRAGEQIAEAIADTGLGVRSLKRSRFATLIEATKGQPARVSFSP